MVFYLKYRPQKINDLDLENVRNRIGNILVAKALPHAYLLIGPKGTGKTSAARIIAKSINCLLRDKETGEPCNKCDICLSITKGTFLDVLEIDGASNRGIDEIRRLREVVKLLPSLGKYKVYIIDEVHMLTIEAFNALLKTLEEPPAHVVFILATTEEHKLPETIISRCIKINFNKAGEGEVLRSLQRIAKGEKLTVDPEVFTFIAAEADGSFRDANKMLEEAAIVNKKITLTAITSLFGKDKKLDNHKFLKYLLDRNTKLALLHFENLLDCGLEAEYIIKQFLGFCHKLLLKNYDLDHQLDKFEVEVTQEEIPTLLKLVDHFLKAYELKYFSPIPALPFEVAIINWCNNQSLKNEASRSDVELKDTKKSEEIKNISKKTKLPFAWEELIGVVKCKNHSVAGLLRSCEPLNFKDGFLEVKAFYKFHKEKLKDQNIQKIINDALKQLIRQDIKLKLV